MTGEDRTSIGENMDGIRFGVDGYDDAPIEGWAAWSEGYSDISGKGKPMRRDDVLIRRVAIAAFALGFILAVFFAVLFGYVGGVE